MKLHRTVIRTLLLVLPIFAAVGSTGGPVEAEGQKSINLQFVDAGGGPPSVVVLADGTVIFKITVIQTVSGDLTGTLTESITQVYPISEENGLLPIATHWRLDTYDGSMEGYYSGKFMHLQDGSHEITEHGEVLSVTGAYVDFYLAIVTYRATLAANHMTAAGSLTFQSRNSRF
jgi:hypothetical protein